jgi:serine/threonine-protein kinase
VAEPLTVILERYRLDALIGEGGMANVWRAWDLTLQRPVAVKLLFARDARDEDALVKRFLREARIAASVQHRNVIHIVDFGTTPENQPFMVMELLEGETLAARLRRDKRLSVADTVQIANLTLRGLSAVHAAGIIHRDLKPDNVYLKAEGGVVYPKILDFGISRSIEPASGSRSALTTRDGVIVGTPEYMSPEQARGMKRLDYRTDLYSMGVVLYEALTGRLPYRSENVGDLIIKIVTGIAPMVHELAPEVPVPLSEVVACAMSRNAGDRFTDANAMQEALLDAVTRALGARAVHALSDLPPQQMGLAPLPFYLRTTRRPPSVPQMQPAPRATQPAPRPTQPAPGPTAMPAEPTTSAPLAPSHGASGPLAPHGASGPLAPPIAMKPSRAAAIGTSPSVAPTAGSNPPSDGTSASLAPTIAIKQRLARWQERWTLPLMASGSVVAFGALILWLAPAAEPSPVSLVTPARVVPRVETTQPETVTLTLRGVPDGATVMLDGQRATSILTLPRGLSPRSLVVSATGKTPWHISYVPNADQELEVSLRDEAQPPSAAAKAKRTPQHGKHGKRIKRIRKAPGALRVPDF